MTLICDSKLNEISVLLNIYFYSTIIFLSLTNIFWNNTIYQIVSHKSKIKQKKWYFSSIVNIIFY